MPNQKEAAKPPKEVYVALLTTHLLEIVEELEEKRLSLKEVARKLRVITDAAEQMSTQRDSQTVPGPIYLPRINMLIGKACHPTVPGPKGKPPTRL